MNSLSRTRLIAGLEHRLLPGPGCTIVGVDGVDGAGKTTFADSMSVALRAGGRSVVRISVDDFHNPRAVRYRQGRLSPDGFYENAFDYDRLREFVLDPLRPEGSGVYRARSHDVATDAYVDAEAQTAKPGSIVIVDGLFLHRPQLLPYWDLSVFLDVPLEVSVQRMAARDGTPDDPAHPVNQRYIKAQERYLLECDPRGHATFVIDNTDPDYP